MPAGTIQYQLHTRGGRTWKYYRQLNCYTISCFDEKNYSLSEIIEALKKNFKGEEELRYRLIHETPKYGNDDDYADQAAQEVLKYFTKL